MIVEELSDDLAETLFFREINTGFPLQGRKWLSLLEADAATGFRIRPDLDLDRRHLGFTFRSNAHGLRGPADRTAEVVMFGTSYAMGFAVDEGDNWYDGLAVAGGALNLGLPVGPREAGALAADLHRGDRRLAVLLYHPNFWEIAANFQRWRAAGDDVFTVFRWDRSLVGALEKSRERLDAVRRGLGRSVVVAEIDGRPLLLNAGYARFAPRPDADYRGAADDLRLVLAGFDRVLAVRIPTKETLAAERLNHPGLEALRDNHAHGWTQFRRLVLDRLPCCDVIEDGGFELADYLPCDTHWNRRGNGRFRALLAGYLTRIGR